MTFIGTTESGGFLSASAACIREFARRLVAASCNPLDPVTIRGCPGGPVLGTVGAASRLPDRTLCLILTTPGGGPEILDVPPCEGA